MGVCEYTVKNCDKLSSAFNKGDTRRRGIMRGILKRSDKNWLENLRSLMVDYYASVEGSMDTPTPGRSCHVCPHCGDGKLYSSQHALKRHLRTHSVPLEERQHYKCDLCNEAYVAKKSLDKHGKTCQGNKIHSCKRCDETFYNTCDLKEHRKIHEDIKFNGESFCKSSSKVILKQRKKSPSGTILYECNMCPKMFRSKKTFRIHNKSHKLTYCNGWYFPEKN